MSIHYEITQTGLLTRIRFLKKPSVEDCLSGLDEIALKYPSPLRLWDFSSGFDLPANDLRKIAEHSKTRFQFKSKLALLVPNDLSFGVCRMYGVFREDKTVDTMVFKCESEALAWLLKNLSSNVRLSHHLAVSSQPSGELPPNQ